MRKLLPRALARSATLLAVVAPSAGAYWGHHDRVETVYVEPTTMIVPSSYAEIVPTSYAYPVTTSYVTTSATLLPASYAYTTTSYTPATTAYYVPTYYRRGLFGRRLERTAFYEPTAYYLPTTVASMDAPVMATSYRGPCEESTVTYTPPSPVPGATSKGIVSKSTGEPGYIPPADKKKDPVMDAEKAKDKAGAGGLADPPAGEASPPEKPAAEKPADPAPEIPDNNPKLMDRQVRRPAATEMRPKLNASAQNVLRGEVVSGVSGKAIGSVKVVFSDLSGHYKDRVKETDDKGNFDVFLPSGDWSITIIDPAAAVGGQPKVMGNITSTSGKYLDDSDRPIYSLKFSI